MEIAVLIPAYQPDSVLISLVQALHRENFRLIVTDDGSGPAYADIFSALLPYAEVLTCPENRGKGRALKCALRHLAADPQGCRAFITADADGQHTVADILRVREALLSGSRFVLTTRTLHGKSVPLRSRVGNDLSRFFFSLAAGCFLKDNQSGLRGFSTDCLPWLTEIGGEKYDYEMNVLLYAARQELSITQLPIETVYLDGNQSSHFDPLRDTLRIYRRMLDTARGSVLAWLMIRTDLPGKKILGLLVTVPYMIPSWTKALAWLAMFRNSTSGADGFLAGMGIPIPDWLAYGPIAIVLCMSMHYYAFSYIMVSGALRSINSELEEMGEIQGASKAQILRHITLPLILPSVLSATVMTISKSIGTYGVPANLGNRIGYYTLATKMRNFIDQGPQAVGYAMSIVLVLLAALIIFSNQRIVGVRKSYATVSGKGGRATLMPLGKAKKPLMAFLMVFLFLAMVVPFFVLIMETFQITTGAGYGLDNLTLYNWIGKSGQIAKYTNYEGIFRDPKFFSAFWNTIRLTLIGSIITAICGQFLGYISSRGRGKWYGDLTEQMVFVPYLMSGIAFSTMYFSMFSRPHLGGLLPSLYGTFTLIVLTSVVKHFPGRLQICKRQTEA